MLGRIVGIDYGLKRVGLAVTDPLQIIATPLTTVRTAHVLAFLVRYVQQEGVVAFVVGLPKRLNHRPSSLAVAATKFVGVLQKAFPAQQVFQHDERYTSKLAWAGLVAGGFKRKDRRNKANLDKLSATIILESFLTSYRRNRV